jgi:hypothetical protein
MAELTVLESKLAEVLGLAEAASGAGERISNLVDDERLRRELERMRQEAEETVDRCTQVAESLDGKKTAVLEKARETKQEASEMMRIYLGDDADGLDGFEFLTMAEAGEVGHWEILGVLGEKAAHTEINELVQWAKPIQERHFETAREGSLQLAAQEDPNEEQ